MRNMRVLAFLLAPLLFVAALIVVSSATAAPQAAAPKNRTFVAVLSGAREVPPVDTRARGVAIFKLNKEGTAIEFKLMAVNIVSFTAAHIHTGTVGTNGGIVANLHMQGQTRLCEDMPNGVRCSGTIIAANLSGALQDKPLSDLITLIREARAYVNVHSENHMGGEIRGQLGHRKLWIHDAQGQGQGQGNKGKGKGAKP